MITLNEIAYNIKNLAYGGKTSTENNISLRQIKHWIHYHRAKLIADNIDKGILNDQSLYQEMALTLRNSTSGTAADYYAAWDAYDKDLSVAIPALTAGLVENSPRFSSGKLTGEWLGYSSIAYDTSGNEQSYLDELGRDFYGREIKRSQLRGDFRNFGSHSFWTPRPIMLKDNAGIRKVGLTRRTHFPDDITTVDDYEQVGGYHKRELVLPRREWPNYDNYNKFTDNTKPYYTQETSKVSDGYANQNYISLRNLQVSPNYHGGLKTPAAEKIFWSYRGTTEMILENPTDINMMWDWWWLPKVEWDNAVTPYPIPMEYVSDLIQRVIQVEMQTELKTIPDVITDGVDDLIKLKVKGGAQVQR